ncbi:MAG: hypothetical protein WCK51_07115 [Armatimonadota bacterium]
MKTGNPKQAVILAVVAVGAIGFLGTSLFSTFASGSTPAPAPVEIKEKSPDPAVTTTKPSSEKLPATEPGESEEIESDLPPKIDKTPFGKLEPKKPIATVGDKKPPASLPKAGRKGSQAERETTPLDPTSENHPGLPATGELPAGGGEAPENADTPKPIMIRFEGFVDAGNPVAIIRIGESQYTADQGEGLPYGIRVIAMTSEKLTLSIRGRRKSVWIGREVQL